MMTESWQKALGRYFGYSLRISAAATVVAVAFCWYYEMLSLATLSNALQWTGALVGGFGVWSLIGAASGSSLGVQLADDFNTYPLLPHDRKLWRSDLIATYRFGLTIMVAGLMTVGIGYLLGMWVGMG